MISIEEINLLKGQNEALLKQNKDLQKQVLNLKAENDFLKKELGCSIELRKQIQNDLLKSDRLNDKLEAENTELSKIIDCKNGTIATLTQTRDRLKENIEDLSKDLKVQNEIIGKLEAENERLKRENEIITGIYNIANARFDKIYQTLQEIKAIAEMDICSNCITQKKEYNCQCLADTILQLITKAEEE